MASIADKILATGPNTAATPQVLEQMNIAKMMGKAGNEGGISEAFRNALLELENQTLKQSTADTKKLNELLNQKQELEQELASKMTAEQRIAEFIKKTNMGDTEGASAILQVMAIQDSPSSALTALLGNQNAQMRFDTAEADRTEQARQFNLGQSATDRQFTEDQRQFNLKDKRTANLLKGVDELEGLDAIQRLMLKSDFNTGTTGMFKAMHDARMSNPLYLSQMTETAETLFENELLSEERLNAYLDWLWKVEEGNAPTTSAIVQRRKMLDDDYKVKRILTKDQHKKGVLQIHEILDEASKNPEKMDLYDAALQNFGYGTANYRAIEGVIRPLNLEEGLLAMKRLQYHLKNTKGPDDLKNDPTRLSDATYALKNEVDRAIGKQSGEAIDKLRDAEDILLNVVPVIFEEIKKIDPDKLGVIERKTEQFAQFIGQVKDPELRRIETAIQKLINHVLRIQTGAAITPVEPEQFIAFLPSVGNKMQLNRAIVDGYLLYAITAKQGEYGLRVGEKWADMIMDIAYKKAMNVQAEIYKTTSAGKTEANRKKHNIKTMGDQ